MANHVIFTERKREEFLDHVKEHGNVTLAAKQIGVGRRTLYDAKEEDPNFAEAWDNAFQEFLDTVEAEVKRRAVEGVEKPVYYQGKTVGKIKEYSDLLLMFYLKRYRPEFRDSTKIDLTVPEETARFIMRIGGREKQTTGV